MRMRYQVECGRDWTGAATGARECVSRAGTHFTCFTSTKVQTLTPLLQEAAPPLAVLASAYAACLCRPPPREQVGMPLLHSALRAVIELIEPTPRASPAPHPTRAGCGANGGKDICMRMSYDSCVCRMPYADACVFYEAGCGAHGAPRR